MANPKDEVEGSGTEDLFEDLDKFFSPIEETEWPDTAPASPPRAAERPATSPPASSPPASSPPPSADDEEILPQGWTTELDLGTTGGLTFPDEGSGPSAEETLWAEGATLAEHGPEEPPRAAPAEAGPLAAEESRSGEPAYGESGPAGPAPDTGMPGGGTAAPSGAPPGDEALDQPVDEAFWGEDDDDAVRPPGPPPTAVPVSPGLGEAPSEAGPDDTAAMPVLPDDEPTDIGDAAFAGFEVEGEAEPPALPPSRGADGPVYAEPGHGEQDSGELTIDDLKVAPPQYANLPGPADDDAEEPEDATAEGMVFGEPLGEPLGEALDPAAAVAGVPAGAEVPPRPGEGEPAEPSFAGTFEDDLGEGPASGDAERAAQHFAEGMRESPEEVERELLAGLEPGRVAPPRMVKVGSDEPISGSGPSWEEPMSQAVVSETGTRAPGRDLPAALITGVALAALALILIAVGPAPFAYLAGLLVLLAQGELYAVARRRGHQPATALGLACGALMLFAAYNKGEGAMAFIMSLALVLTFFWYMAAPPKARKGTFANIAVTILGLVYVPFFAGFLFRLLPLPGGRAIVLGIIALTVIDDVVAFWVGSLWGRRPLSPTLSPNKSWEGLIGASIVVFLIALAFGPSIDPFAVGSALGMALVVVVMAPLGDLAESSLKRDLGVKDMGTILPGHGGLLDRIDSLLFVAPAAYTLMRIVFF